MSRSPDYDTPVEQMDGNALIENALAMQKAAVFEMDRDELMAENVRLGASQFTPKTCLGCGGASSLMAFPRSHSFLKTDCATKNWQNAMMSSRLFSCALIRASLQLFT